MSDVVFVENDGIRVGEVGDGLMGPAGTMTLAIDGVEMVFDRVDPYALMEIRIPNEVEFPLWLSALIPDLHDVGNGTGSFDASVDSTVFHVVGKIARLDAELRELDETFDDSALADAFRVAANLEMAITIRAGGEQLLAALRSEIALARARDVLDTSADSSLVWDQLTDPTKEKASTTFAALCSQVEEDFGPIAAFWSSHATGNFELSQLPSTPSLTVEPIAAIRSREIATAKNSLPCAEVINGAFDLDASLVASKCHGRVGEHLEDIVGYRVTIDSIRREPSVGAEYGPMWIRLFSNGHLVAGGLLNIDDDDIGEAVLPHSGAGLPTIDQVEVWINPYRYSSGEAVVEARSPIDCAYEALEMARTAARVTGLAQSRAWRRAAEAWLAAGYFDRAALAFDLAHDPEKYVWSRSQATMKRFGQNPTNPLLSLYWHPSASSH